MKMILTLALALLLFPAVPGRAGDWPMWGYNAVRNFASGVWPFLGTSVFTLDGIRLDKDLKIEFTPSDGSEYPPILCGVELIPESASEDAI